MEEARGDQAVSWNRLTEEDITIIWHARQILSRAKVGKLIGKKSRSRFQYKTFRYNQKMMYQKAIRLLRLISYITLKIGWELP